MIKGIGPVLAGKLVKKFGEGVFRHHRPPERAPGGSGQGGTRDAAVASRPPGPSKKWCARSWCSCTRTAPARVAPCASTRPTANRPSKPCARNPYQLARDIHGIGLQDRRRHRAPSSAWPPTLCNVPPPVCGTRFSRRPTKDTAACPKPILIQNTRRRCSKSNEGIVIEALAKIFLYRRGIGKRDDVGGPTLLVYLPGLLGAEKTIARRILAPCRASLPNYPEIRPGRARSNGTKGKSEPHPFRPANGAALGRGVCQSKRVHHHRRPRRGERRPCSTRCFVHRARQESPLPALRPDGTRRPTARRGDGP